MRGGVKAAVARVQEALAANLAPSPVDMQMLRSINVDSVRGEVGSAAGLDRAQRLIVDLARTFGLNSVELHAKLARYEGSAWKRERTESECPRRRAGHPEAMCWEILRIYGRTPSGRTIRRILEAQSGGHFNTRDGRGPLVKTHRS